MSEVRETTTPWRRDPSQLTERFRSWLGRVLPAGASPEVTELSTPGQGYSSDTLLVDARWTESGEERADRFAVRLAPDPEAYPVFPTYDLDLQGRCMQLVGELTKAPVPDVLWHEPDTSWLGSPFLVMRRVEGEAPADVPPYLMTGWLFDAPPERRAHVERRAIEVLTEIHKVTPQRADLSFLEPGAHGSAVDQQLAHQREYYGWARDGVRYSVIENMFEWVEANRPPS